MYLCDLNFCILSFGSGVCWISPSPVGFMHRFEYPSWWPNFLLDVKTDFFPEFWWLSTCFLLATESLCCHLQALETLKLHVLLRHVSVGSTRSLKAFVIHDDTWAPADAFYMEAGSGASGEERRHIFVLLFVPIRSVGPLKLPLCKHITVSSSLLRLPPACSVGPASFSRWSMLCSFCLHLRPYSGAALWLQVHGSWVRVVCYRSVHTGSQENPFPYVTISSFRSHRKCASISEDSHKSIQTLTADMCQIQGWAHIQILEKKKSRISLIADHLCALATDLGQLPREGPWHSISLSFLQEASNSPTLGSPGFCSLPCSLSAINSNILTTPSNVLTPFSSGTIP